MTDTERLDWLEGKKGGYGDGWVCRPSVTGRGYRVHETSSKWGCVKPTVREAIDCTMEMEEKNDDF